jgi:hypothetical protein
MSENFGHRAHMAHTMLDEMKGMGPLGARKNAWAAFTIGFLFGAPGLGLYFWSWKEFFYSLIANAVGLALMVPTFGLSWWVGALALAIYGARRVVVSNQHFLSP